MNLIRNLIHKIEYLGVIQDFDYALVQKVKISNLVFLVSTICSATISFALFINDVRIETTLFNIIITFFIFICSLLNWLGKINFSRNFYLFTVLLGICSSPFYLGEAINMGIFLIPSIGLPFVLFTRTERKYIFAWVALIILSYFVILLLYTVVTPLDSIPEETSVLINKVVNVVMFGWLASLFVLITNNEKIREETLKKALENQTLLQSIIKKNRKEIDDQYETIIQKEREKVLVQDPEDFALKKGNVFTNIVPDRVVLDVNIKLNLKVLLVDDMELNLSLAKAMLEECGCTVDTANCGLKAFDQYKVGRYDLVLIDINMPDLNGDLVVRKIREKYKNDSIFIGLSANGMDGERERYLQNGLDDYLSKPITFDKLLNCLDAWFTFPDNQVARKRIDTCFLIDLEVVNRHAIMMGGKLLFTEFIDKFIIQNNTIFKEIILAYNNGSDQEEELAVALHKLSGISSSMGAKGYSEILQEAYSSVKKAIEFSKEEFTILESASKEVNQKFSKLKEEWEKQRES